jgi:hypothetical protein
MGIPATHTVRKLRIDTTRDSDSWLNTKSNLTCCEYGSVFPIFSRCCEHSGSLYALYRIRENPGSLGDASGGSSSAYKSSPQDVTSRCVYCSWGARISTSRTKHFEYPSKGGILSIWAISSENLSAIVSCIDHSNTGVEANGRSTRAWQGDCWKCAWHSLIVGNGPVNFWESAVVSVNGLGLDCGVKKSGCGQKFHDNLKIK